jgi:flagellar FliL protein
VKSEGQLADVAEPQDVAPKKSKKPLIIGLVLAILLGGGGFYATYSGMILAPAEQGAAHPESTAEALPDIAFVPIEPLVISLGDAASGRFLRFTSQLEVNGPMVPDVTLLLPRIVDVVNGYLRAIEPASLDEPAMMMKIRAQLLRRVQMVTGEGRVRDLLITEFVLN